LLKNGTLIDSTTSMHRLGDLAVEGSLIGAVLDSGTAVDAKRVIDVSGLLVMPGFIDLHVHVYSGTTHYGVDVDPNCLGRGVTTALDAGSAGSATFPGFRN
jgi:dihydroorotase